MLKESGLDAHLQVRHECPMRARLSGAPALPRWRDVGGSVQARGCLRSALRLGA